MSLFKGRRWESICASTQRSSRARSPARAFADSRSSGRAVRTAGSSKERPGARRARRLPAHTIPILPSSSTISENSLSAAPVRASARRSSSSPRRRSAAARRRRLSASRAAGSTRNSKPTRWPIGSGPTLTSPSSETVIGRAAAPRAPMSRTSTEVRRSTKRWVSAEWSASDSRDSTSRVRSAHFAGSCSQSERWAM